MSDVLAEALGEASAGRDLSTELTEAAFGEIMAGNADEVRIAGLLVALRTKGETADELLGVARTLRERCTRIDGSHGELLDTCGTGGDGLHTFNISTATALVVAACGVRVAKHGNRSVSSSSGSADVLEELGVNVQLDTDAVARCLDEVGIGFCFAPLHHAAMKYAAPVRKRLGLRTIFNLVGPLVNPAGAGFQVLGTNSDANAELIATTLSNLGTTRSVVVCGNGELDEVCLWGPTRAREVDTNGIREHVWHPETFGLPECRVADVTVSSPAESADVIRGILDGDPGPARDLVVANTAAALWTVGRAETVRAGTELASAAIQSGEVKRLLNQLVAFTQGA